MRSIRLARMDSTCNYNISLVRVVNVMVGNVQQWNLQTRNCSAKRVNSSELLWEHINVEQQLTICIRYTISKENFIVLKLKLILERKAERIHIYFFSKYIVVECFLAEVNHWYPMPLHPILLSLFERFFWKYVRLHF